MSDDISNTCENLFKRYDYLMNRQLNKDIYIRNIAQRLEETLNLLEIALEDGNEINVIKYSTDATMYRNTIKSLL
jgi:hypothetical protein